MILSIKHVALGVLELYDSDIRRLALRQIDLEKACGCASHSILFSILYHVGVGKTIYEGVEMAHKNCIASFNINK
ncbi:MAG: hypothetical protein O7D30_09805 [Rickettsia endosymbiont of Ixodes persulcatus]|nr:hypothetical protein [Rickettsia endosymbiont of Ixodes persulcatus]